jgi:hypothetical protein
MKMSPQDVSSLKEGSLGGAWKGFSYMNEDKGEPVHPSLGANINFALMTEEPF